MKKIFTYDKYKLTLYDVCSTIILMNSSKILSLSDKFFQNNA